MGDALLVTALDEDSVPDFLALHSEANGCGWCRCVAWWVDGWDGWGERTDAENLSLRQELFARGEYDGLIGYADDEPVGWVQVGPRDRLAKLRLGAGLEPDPRAWAVSCFLVAPSRRGRGVAEMLLTAAIEHARAEGASTLEGFPKRGDRLAPGEVWTGPEALFRRAGFEHVADAGARAVWRLTLGARPTPGASTPR